MDNIVPLFQETKIVVERNAAESVRISIIKIVAQNTKLVRAVRDLQVRLDALDEIVDSIDDRHSRERLLEMSRFHRETLIRASNELSFELRKLPLLWVQLSQNEELLESPVLSVSL